MSFEQILGLDPSFEYDEIATIVSFLIYKEWLLSSLESKHRSTNLDKIYYKSELQLRIDIYKLCRCIDQNHVDNLMEIMLLMRTFQAILCITLSIYLTCMHFCYAL